MKRLRTIFARRRRDDYVETRSVYAAYRSASKRLGLSSLGVFLSFDCDTPEDAEVVDELARELNQLGLTFSLSVPGQTLLQSASTYRAISEAGVEFMNHGFARHAIWNVDHYVSTTFYRDMTNAEIVADIQHGHEAVLGVTGQSARGFRTPHFGTFQEVHQIRLIHETIRTLGYSYSSSTLPSKALDNGPLFDGDGIVEIPLSGSISAPTTVIDSWTYLEDKKNITLGEAYFQRVEETVQFFLDESIPGLLSLYADPRHVVGQSPFWAAMELIQSKGLPSFSGEQVAGLAKPA